MMLVIKMMIMLKTMEMMIILKSKYNGPITFLIGTFLSSLVGCHIVLLVHDCCYNIMAWKSLNLGVKLASDPPPPPAGGGGESIAFIGLCTAVGMCSPNFLADTVKNRV